MADPHLLGAFESKFCPISIKASGAAGVIEGYGSTFNSEPDSYGDVIAPGAFTETLAKHKADGTRPKMLWQHDRDAVLGKWTEFVEDERGLKLVGQLNLKVQRAKDAYEHLLAGDLDGLSIGYRTRSYEVDTETETFTLTAVDLYEVSVVTIGANPDATVEGVKAARAVSGLIDKLKAGDRLTEREFEALLKGLGGLSNAEAERAVRVHLKAGSGDPTEAAIRDLRALAEGLAS